MQQKQIPVAVIGCGGHGRVVMAALIAAGHRVVAATDLFPDRCKKTDPNIEVMTDEALRTKYAPDKILLSLGIGSVLPTNDQSMTYRTVKSFEKLGYRFVGFTHPTAWVASGAIVAETSQIHAGAIVQPGAIVGDFSIMNTKSSIDHDCCVGSFCHICPGATVSGNVSIGDGSHLGTACTIIQGIRIGSESFVAAGATVVRDVGDGMSVRGVPAKSFFLRR